MVYGFLPQSAPILISPSLGPPPQSVLLCPRFDCFFPPFNHLSPLPSPSRMSPSHQRPLSTVAALTGEKAERGHFPSTQTHLHGLHCTFDSLCRCQNRSSIGSCLRGRPWNSVNCVHQISPPAVEALDKGADCTYQCVEATMGGSPSLDDESSGALYIQKVKQNLSGILCRQFAVVVVVSLPCLVVPCRRP